MVQCIPKTEKLIPFHSEHQWDCIFQGCIEEDSQALLVPLPVLPCSFFVLSTLQEAHMGARLISVGVEQASVILESEKNAQLHEIPFQIIAQSS